ncbi:hypothetical protein JHK82_031731 [Glycine max]|nr:hypothetical protein JHK86_031824 [Glycine max]KAG5124994.1 hypothetical protein JHK82_031731 [Glycine max]KAG5146422.1 hypothetical protein JHK84_031965 [Glycine max]
MEENPNLEAQKFFDMLATVQAPLWEGCEHHLELSTSLACLSLKSDYNMSEGYFNRMVQLMGNTMPKNNTMVKQVYYTTYPEGHRGWLTVMKTKARNINTNNIVSETKQRAPYQDDELVELQEVLEVNPDVINESLADVDGGGEEIDASLLKQLDLVELDEDECILSENDIESDFDDIDTS